MNSTWLDSKRDEFPFRARSKDKSLSLGLNISHCSSVERPDEGRTYAFKTAEDRDEFLRRFPDAVIVP